MTRWGAIATAFAVAVVGASAVYDSAVAAPALLRPPGALGNGGFSSRCIRCGRCIEACPYRAIHAAPLSAGSQASTPCIDPRQCACSLCADFPCISACPTGALAPVESPSEVAMGVAILYQERCLSYKAMRCEVCYRACPFIDQAITIDYRQREGDAIHAVFAPQVHEGKCVGCGLCVQRCPVEDPSPSISIVPAGQEAAR